jgi:biofilm PGA synthesis N-glycosyltransferase PgaC
LTRNKDIAILIPFRNEEQNLVSLLQDLYDLNFKDECELIFINDHSTDGSVQIIESHPLFSFVTLLELPAQVYGKKKALECGVEFAHSSVFWSIDADVRMNKFQLNHLKFWKQLEFDLLVLPVSMSNGDGPIGKIQMVEWQLLQAWTFLSLEAGFPLLANGANLVFTRKLFLEQEVSRFGNLSGDDMNILHCALTISSKICYQNLEAVSVQIHAVKTWSEFLTQRWRWAGKIKHYPRSAFHVFAILFFVWNLTLLALEGLVFYHWMFTIPLLCLAAVQLAFVWRNQKQVNGNFSALDHLVFVVIYPVMSLFFFITSKFINVKWKGRHVSLNHDSQARK